MSRYSLCWETNNASVRLSKRINPLTAVAVFRHSIRKVIYRSILVPSGSSPSVRRPFLLPSVFPTKHLGLSPALLLLIRGVIFACAQRIFRHHLSTVMMSSGPACLYSSTGPHHTCCRNPFKYNVTHQFETMTVQWDDAILEYLIHLQQKTTRK